MHQVILKHMLGLSATMVMICWVRMDASPYVICAIVPPVGGAVFGVRGSSLRPLSVSSTYSPYVRGPFSPPCPHCPFYPPSPPLSIFSTVLHWETIAAPERVDPVEDGEMENGGMEDGEMEEWRNGGVEDGGVEDGEMDGGLFFLARACTSLNIFRRNTPKPTLIQIIKLPVPRPIIHPTNIAEPISKLYDNRLLTTQTREIAPRLLRPNIRTLKHQISHLPAELTLQLLIRSTNILNYVMENTYA